MQALGFKASSRLASNGAALKRIDQMLNVRQQALNLRLLVTRLIKNTAVHASRTGIERRGNAPGAVYEN
jgi:hypothetical protein